MTVYGCEQRYINGCFYLLDYFEENLPLSPPFSATPVTAIRSVCLEMIWTVCSAWTDKPRHSVLLGGVISTVMFVACKKLTFLCNELEGSAVLKLDRTENRDLLTSWTQNRAMAWLVRRDVVACPNNQCTSLHTRIPFTNRQLDVLQPLDVSSMCFQRRSWT